MRCRLVFVDVLIVVADIMKNLWQENIENNLIYKGFFCGKVTCLLGLTIKSFTCILECTSNFMDSVKKKQVVDYINQRIRSGRVRAEGYVFDVTGRKKHPNRNCFVVLNRHLINYLNKRFDERLFILYGLRGTGKTTLLSQLYSEIPHIPDEHKLFLSLDEVTNMLGVTLKDVLGVYEEILGDSFEMLPHPVFLFLDEIHFDNQWVMSLKTVYGRAKNVFIVATGSSALTLQINLQDASSDLARREISTKLYPMQFTEYIKIRDHDYGIKNLADDIRNAIFNSRDALSVYTSLSKHKPRVQKYWSKLAYPKDVDMYLDRGTFPFTVFSSSDAVAHDQVKKMLERVVSIDMPAIEKFSPDIVSKIPSLLYMLASAEQCNLSSISKSLGINRQTLSSILDALEKTEVLWRLYPYGSHYAQVRKPSKYLFSSPAFRSMYFNLTEDVSKYNDYKGKLLEDAVASSLRRLFSEKTGFSLTYDSSEGGADFVIRRSGKVSVVEVGYGEKNTQQIVQTMQRIQKQEPVSYGILVSRNPLDADPEKNIVEIPITYFLLV